MSPAEPAPTGDGRPAEDGHGLPPGYLLRPMTVWDVPEVLAHEATLFPLDAWPAHFYEEELAQTGPAGGRDAHGRPPTRDYRVVVRDVAAPGAADDDGPAPGEIVGYGGIMV
ncbi:alanine acetyltransferase, partial [Micrococcus luteus]|nr:alanine acetyltransferase [Micrococcus luteus]